MYKVTKYPHGTFNWADNTSTNAEAAKAFYMDLFGWGKIDEPLGGGMTYTMFQHEGEHAAGFAAMMPDMQAQGIPSHWTNYVSVDDVDAMVAPIRANGGTILVEPMDIFDSGRMLLLVDPTGAQLGLWQPKNHIGAGIVNTAGAMCWNELCTNDTEAAKTFYSAVLGWEFYGDEHYIHITNKGRNNGGMIKLDENFGEMPPCWMVYFHVADIDAGIERVQALGGSITVPKHAIPDGAWWAVAADPAGAHFYIMQRTTTEPWIE